MTLNWAFFTTLFAVLGWMIPIVMLFIVPVNRKPSSATAWLMLLFLFPFVGLVIFLLIGSPKLPRRRRAQQHTMTDMIENIVTKERQKVGLKPLLSPPIPERYEPFIQLNTNLSEMPAFAGNSVELIPDYKRAIECIAEEIDHARLFAHIEYFALSRDAETECVFTALERAQQRGVKVRVLLDHLGSRKYPRFKNMLKWLKTKGIEYHIMLPLHFFGPKYTRFDLRNHRKIVVIDDAVGFTGSLNMIKRNYFRKDAIYYEELVTRVSGPVVGQLEAAFLTDWYAESGTLPVQRRTQDTPIIQTAMGDILCQVVPSGSGFDNDNNLKLFNALFYKARHKLVITNPYFVPDDSLMMAITSAAERGVDVTLINSEAMDQFFVCHAQRSYYEALLKAGIKIYWYPAPALLHAKHISIDDDIAVIGSSNMDIRSFQLNMEVTLICYDCKVVADMRRIEEQYLEVAMPINLLEWQTRSARTRLAENIARLTAALQ